jgi:hypothetical protein
MGVVKREKAVIGVFITLNSPTKPMEIEAVREGFYIPEHFPKDRYPRIQILTIEDILKEASIQYPRLADATFKTAERKYKAQVPTQSKLL